jgi:hypothetical protein
LGFKLTAQEGQRLTACMLAMRPDWTKNNPGKMLADINTGAGFPGRDFEHALRALAVYATARGADGAHQYRTPDIYPREGKHWTSTGAADWTPPKPTPCPDHIGEPSHACRCCHADVKAGIRPADLIGKHHEPESEEDA